ncbi:MAG: hypothetical protein WC822_06735 [Candidatus Paceibacterota bacterium]
MPFFVGFSVIYFSQKEANQNVGVVQAIPIASFETSLASRVSDTATSMTLVSIATQDGTDLVAGSRYGFTIDDGYPTLEYVLGYVSTTTTNEIVMMTRGVSTVTGTSTVTALKQNHSRGASVKISTAPIVLQLAAQLSGRDTIDNAIFYGSDISTSTISSHSNRQILATAEYIDFVGSSGCANANETTRGCAELATQIESASSTATGSSGATLVQQAQYATSSPGIAGLWDVWTNNAGKIAQSFFDLTATYPWTGHHTFTSAFTTAASSTNATSTDQFVTSLGTAAGTLVGADPLGRLIATSTPVSSYVGATFATSTSDTSGSTYTQDTTYTTTFLPTTITLYVFGKGEDGAGNDRFLVETSVFSGTSCMGGLTLKGNTTTDTQLPSGASAGCVLAAGDGGNGVKLTASITSVTSTGFTVRITHAGGGTYGAGNMSITPVAYR